MKYRILAALAAVACCGACDTPRELAFLNVPTCRVATPPTPLSPELSETSGVVASRTSPGTVWTHTDSGTEPILYALDGKGTILSRVRLAIDTPDSDSDWEDLAAGACPLGECLYVADIGDNAGSRPNVVVHRLAEPTSPAGKGAAVESFRMRFPEGPRDAEALFVMPGEHIYVVTKGGDGPIGIYEYPGSLDANEVVVLQLVRNLTASQVQLGDRVTGASASADGRWIALRTHVSVMVYAADELLSDAGEVQPFVVSDVRPLAEPQGEGIGLGPNGTIVLTSEGGAPGIPGTMSVLWCDGLEE